jgi:hypothetical protein
MFLIEYINNLITLLVELKNSSTVLAFFFKLVGIAIALIVVKEIFSFFASAYSIYSRVKSTSKESNDRHFIAKSAWRMGVDELLGFIAIFLIVLVGIFLLGKMGLNVDNITNLFK